MSIIDYLCRGRDFDRKLSESRERLYRLAYSWCHKPDLADDLVQETCSKALNRRQSLREDSAFDTWIFRILANTWYDHLKLQKEVVEYDDVYVPDDTTPEYIHSRYQTIVDVRQAVSQLPLGQRQVLSLIELEQFSYSEVAEILDIPVGTVMSRLSRARKQLKELLLATEKFSAKVTALRSQK